MLLTVQPEGGPAAFTLRLRVPDDLREAELLMNGQKTALPQAERGYLCLRRVFAPGDTVELRGKIPLITETIGGSVAFRYGCLALAWDEEKAPDGGCPAPVMGEDAGYRLLPPQEGEMVRLLLGQKPGLLLTDYASCGKRWNQPKNRVTVWMRKP